MTERVHTSHDLSENLKSCCVRHIYRGASQCKELQGQLLDPGTPLVDSTDMTLVDKDANSILPSGVRLIPGNLAMQVAPPGKMGCIWIYLDIW